MQDKDCAVKGGVDVLRLPRITCTEEMDLLNSANVNLKKKPV